MSLTCAKGCGRMARGRSNFCGPCWDEMMRQEQRVSLSATTESYVLGLIAGVLIGLMSAALIVYA